MEKTRKSVSITCASIGNGLDLAVAMAETMNRFNIAENRKVDMTIGIANGFQSAANLLEASEFDGARCAEIFAEAAKAMFAAMDECAKEMEEGRE